MRRQASAAVFRGILFLAIRKMVLAGDVTLPGKEYNDIVGIFLCYLRTELRRKMRKQFDDNGKFREKGNTTR